MPHRPKNDRASAVLRSCLAAAIAFLLTSAPVTVGRAVAGELNGNMASLHALAAAPPAPPVPATRILDWLVIGLYGAGLLGVGWWQQ